MLTVCQSHGTDHKVTLRPGVRNILPSTVSWDVGASASRTIAMPCDAFIISSPTGPGLQLIPASPSRRSRSARISLQGAPLLSQASPYLFLHLL